jgi:molecular chaperone DnaK
VTRLGIDFGTANTVAVLAPSGGTPAPLLFDGSPLLPSAVCLVGGGRFLVGRDAQHTALAAPASFEPHPKLRVDAGTVLLDGVEVPVRDLIAAVLRRVGEEATRVGGGSPTETVLTCPAAWGAARRAVLLDAAAALPAPRLVDEPVAAAYRFAAAAPVGEPFLVYDFGAGTFDASVVRRTPDGFEVLASDGLADCGGLDVDAALVAHLAGTFASRDPQRWARLATPRTTADRRASRQLWDGVRGAKEMLSRVTATLVHVPLFEVDAPIGREEFETLAAPVIARTVAACASAVSAAGARPTAVYLAGGSSRIPAVATALHRELGVAPTVVDQPELAVAQGSLLAGATAAPSPDLPTVVLGPSERPRRRWPAAVAGLVVVALAALAAVLLNRPSDGGTSAAPRTSAAVSPTSTMAALPSVSAAPSYPAGVDSCLIGSWKKTSGFRLLLLQDNNQAPLRGGVGETITYHVDGTFAIDFRPGTPYKGRYNGVRWEERFDGTAQGRYQVTGNQIVSSSVKANGQAEVLRNGSLDNSRPLALTPGAEVYTCAGSRLTFNISYASGEYVKVK